MNSMSYFQCSVHPKKMVLFTSLFRSIEDHFAFDRVEDKKEHIVELFVPIKLKNTATAIIITLHKENLIDSWKEGKILDSSLYNYKNILHEKN